MELLGCGTWRIWGVVSLPFKMLQIHQKLLDSRPPERWWLQDHGNLTTLNGGIQLLGSDNIEVAFSADDKRIAVLSRNRVTVPGESSLIRLKAAFQTCNDLVICAQLQDDDLDEIPGLQLLSPACACRCLVRRTMATIILIWITPC